MKPVAIDVSKVPIKKSVIIENEYFGKSLDLPLWLLDLDLPTMKPDWWNKELSVSRYNPLI